jgi:hypothetical protein
MNRTPDDLARDWADGCSEALRMIVGQAFRAGFAACVASAAEVAHEVSRRPIGTFERRAASEIEKRIRALVAG